MDPDPFIERLMRGLFGVRPVRSLAEAMRRGMVPREFEAEARKVAADLDDAWARHRPPPGRGVGGDPSPWQENAVRALEEAADDHAG